MASPFWTYFHDKLNWLPIFRPGPVSALMKGLALHMDEVRADILWLREQWKPATCEMWLVERYGVSRGIFRNRFDTDESYRKRVVHAYAWHKLGGKVRGVTQILAENGFLDAVIVSVNDVRRHDAMFTHGGSATYNAGLCWAQFDVKFVEIPETGLTRDVLDLFRWLINEYKPARSILRAMSWKVTLVDETDFIEKSVFHVVPTYLDPKPWGFPAHNGQIHYDNGLSRLHDGRLNYGGQHPHTHWQPYGHAHNCVIDPLALRMGTEISENVRYVPLHNGILRYDRYGIHGPLFMPCMDRAATSVVGNWLEPAKADEKLDAGIRQEQFDDIGRYHDGCLTHGQRRVNLHTGAFNHSDSRVYHGLAYSGNPSFRAVRHDGFARYRAEAAHQLWEWLPEAGEKLPAIVHNSFADHQKAQCGIGFADGMELDERVSERVDTAVKPALGDDVASTELAKPVVRPAFTDEAVIYHNGRITYDQRKTSLCLGNFNHDGSRQHASLSENADFNGEWRKRKPVLKFASRFNRHSSSFRHDGRRGSNPFDNPEFPPQRHDGASLRNAQTAHHPWCWLEADPPVQWTYLHSNLSENCKGKCSLRLVEELEVSGAENELIDTSVAPTWRDIAPTAATKEVKTIVQPHLLDDISIRHTGEITHGQRQTSVHLGAFYHDGSRARFVFGGNPSFKPVLHDSRASHNGETVSKYCGWLPGKGQNAPAYTYQTFSDQSAMHFATGMEDDFAISDGWNLSVLRYALYQSQIRHDAANRHRGKEI